MIRKNSEFTQYFHNLFHQNEFFIEICCSVINVIQQFCRRAMRTLLSTWRSRCEWNENQNSSSFSGCYQWEQWESRHKEKTRAKTMKNERVSPSHRHILLTFFQREARAQPMRCVLRSFYCCFSYAAISHNRDYMVHFYETLLLMMHLDYVNEDEF